MSKKILIISILIIAVFVFFRLPILDDMYHQDEYKWAIIVDPSFNLNLESDHPPLIALSYKMTGFIFGFDNLRYLPFLFSILNLILVFLITKKLYGKRAGFLVAFILSLSTYSLLASTQIDIDGAILPFAFLLSVFAYISGDWQYPFHKKNIKWLVLLLVALVFGFSVKLSFMLVVGTIATYHIFSNNRYRDWREWLKIFGIVSLSIVIATLIVYLANKIFGIANADRFIANAGKFGFLNFSERNYFQVLFLGVKSVILISPLILIPVLYAISFKEHIKQFRLWLFFIVYNLIFYFVIFDFTNRTIERYMMFFIIPGAVISGVVISQFFESGMISKLKSKITVFGGLLILFFISSYIVWTKDFVTLPLNPKSAYLDKIRTLDFDFLVPIMGGSGPIGFYVPVVFVLIFFTLATIVFLLIRIIKKPEIRQYLAIVFLAVGVVYNVFINFEFISGYFYGSVDKVAKGVMTEVVNNPSVTKVINYYDYGGYELNKSEKYLKRFYTDPMYAENVKKRFANSKDIYAIIDFPEIDKNSFYWDFLKTCKGIYSIYDKKITGYILDCNNKTSSVQVY